ncbi:hypothetical protein ACKI2A_47400, partial [Streptomyces turgidiscabies]
MNQHALIARGDYSAVRPAAAHSATAHLDSAHTGDIVGAFGTIAQADTGARRGWRRRLATLAAILGPGLIVMVGDNDAGAFG